MKNEEFTKGTKVSDLMHNCTKFEKKEKDKIIFLDIDGVLNGYNSFTGVCYKVFSKLGLLRFVKQHYDLFGVHTNKVKLLSKIVKATNAKIVLSSTWRNSWYKPYYKKTIREKELVNKLYKHGIEVIGITPTNKDNRRELEILSYLSEHEDEIDSFVILDDEKFGIKDLFNDRFVCTSRDGKITGAWHENTGLKRKHIKQAIKILNEQSLDIYRYKEGD
jgi:hypothetical protein